MPEKTPADMDGGWKQLIDDELEEFFRFFFPQVHAAIDFRYGCQSRDKELAKIMVDADVGDREADKLFEVQWRDGGQELVLVHVEVQAQGEQDFARRMYVYNTRIWQRYGRPAVSLALLVDEDPQFRPDQFVREKGGCRLTFTFPVVKLPSHKSEAELEADSNPSGSRRATRRDRQAIRDFLLFRAGFRPRFVMFSIEPRGTVSR